MQLNKSLELASHLKAKHDKANKNIYIEHLEEHFSNTPSKDGQQMKKNMESDVPKILYSRTLFQGK